MTMTRTIMMTRTRMMTRKRMMTSTTPIVRESDNDRSDEDRLEDNHPDDNRSLMKEVWMSTDTATIKV
jgi:hypothetical protein